MWTNGFKNTFNIAAKFNGNKQYPNKQIDWKKLIVPPSSCPLIAIIAPPNHTITNTISNNSVLSSAFVVIDNILHKHRTNWLSESEKLTMRASGRKRMDPRDPSFWFLYVCLRCRPLAWSGLILCAIFTKSGVNLVSSTIFYAMQKTYNSFWNWFI